MTRKQQFEQILLDKKEEGATPKEIAAITGLAENVTSAHLSLMHTAEEIAAVGRPARYYHPDFLPEGAVNNIPGQHRKNARVEKIVAQARAEMNTFMDGYQAGFKDGYTQASKVIE